MTEEVKACSVVATMSLTAEKPRDREGQRQKKTERQCKCDTYSQPSTLLPEF